MMSCLRRTSCVSCPGSSVNPWGGVRMRDLTQPEFRVAVIGGGPGGLFTAWHLGAKAGTSCKITIYEASDRLGGKIVTNEFAGVGPYEAGVAEIYDYSGVGPDPLRELIEKDLNLEITHIRGGACVLDGKILPDTGSLAEHFGPEALEQAEAFYAHCAELLKPSDFYSSARNVDNGHSWVPISGDRLLASQLTDEAAYRYVRTMAHSDVAAAPHLTNGLTFLKNALMDNDGYLKVFSVNGGNELIVRRLAEEIDAEVRLNSPLKSVQPLADGTYRLEFGLNGCAETVVADYVALALPLTALSIVDWRSLPLQQAMANHIRYFDRPGHYLRATLLFERPFWREHVSGAWWMSDSFDGCCIYDEGSRHDLGRWGALGFLIAGNAALGMANMTDERIVELCLDALPHQMAYGRNLMVDSRVHRWMASVSAIPGGYPVRSAYKNHRPDAERFPCLAAVGDYMFDSTLNGVLDSADSATDIIMSDILLRRRAAQQNGLIVMKPSSPLSDPKVCEQFHDASFLADMLKITWGLKPGARILHLGSGSGFLVGALRDLGFDAWGVESDKSAWKKTPSELSKYNSLSKYTRLQTGDRKFDVVLETGLCTLVRKVATRAIVEMRRIARHGVILGSVTTDLTIDIIERHNLLAGVKTLTSRWDWSDQLMAAGFNFSLSGHAILDAAWKRAEAVGAGPGHWYEDAESLLYCFFSVAGATAEQALAAPARAKVKGTSRSAIRRNGSGAGNLPPCISPDLKQVYIARLGANSQRPTGK